MCLVSSGGPTNSMKQASQVLKVLVMRTCPETSFKARYLTNLVLAFWMYADASTRGMEVISPPRPRKSRKESSAMPVEWLVILQETATSPSWNAWAVCGLSISFNFNWQGLHLRYEWNHRSVQRL